MLSTLRFVAALLLWQIAAVAQCAAAEPSSVKLPTDKPAVSTPGATASTTSLSTAGRDVLGHARSSVVQLRGFYGASHSDAFHGTAFAVASDNQSVTGTLLVTNYHVVAEAILFPKKYRLEYRTADGHNGDVQVMAVDLQHDLAVVAAIDLTAAPLRLRTDIPTKGDRAYSVGFPLDLGLTITEGVANGLVEDRLDEHIHYSGAINPGMSGGPALDSAGDVFGVNVAYDARGQITSFVIPAKFIAALLAHVTQPMPLDQARAIVTAQLLDHQTWLLAAMPAKLTTQNFGQNQGKYALPAKIATGVECNSGGDTVDIKRMRIEVLQCEAHASVYVQQGMETGGIFYRHMFLSTDSLSAWQFSEELNHRAEGNKFFGESRDQVAPFTCDNKIVALNGFDARVTTCARAYRMFAGLYDIAVFVTSVNHDKRAIVSTLDLRGVAFKPGMTFATRYLRAMQWTRQ